MSKKHLKRLNISKTWNVRKKGLKYIKRPNPGAHGFNEGMALGTALKDILGIARTNREVRNIINNREVLIDGIRRKELKFIVGFMDVISIPLLKEHFRIVLDKKGKLCAVKIDEKESRLKICRIKGKKMHKKGLQINLSDGRNILTDKKECRVGDSLLIEVPKQNIKELVKLDKGALVMLVKGKHSGSTADIKGIGDDIIKCKNKEGEFETSKEYAFVIGKEKPLVKVKE